MLIVFMKPVKGQLLFHYGQDQQRAGKAYGQSQYIDEGKDLIPNKHPGRYDNDITDHFRRFGM
jgi:hypothetical protein